MKLSARARELFDRLRARVPPGPSQAAAAATRDPIVRRMKFDFAGAEIPRHWAGGSPVFAEQALTLRVLDEFAPPIMAELLFESIGRRFS